MGLVHAMRSNGPLPQVLLENHKCETCPDLLAIFKPYKTASNAEYQQTWYQKNKEKCAKYEKQLAEKSEYQESNRKYAHKHYWSRKKMRSFHQIHLQQIYVSKLCLIFVLILLQRYLKRVVVLF